MRTLNALITHLPAAAVADDVATLRAVAPDAEIAVCHGGSEEEFVKVEHEDKVFLDDPTLRGPPRSLQSWTQVFAAVWKRWFVPNPGLGALYLLEYDHLVLAADFEQRLSDLAVETAADFMGKNCVERTATNWEHYVRFRHDPELLAHLRAVSVRDDPTTLFGCLGDGMWLSRAALEAYVSVGHHPPCYNELYVPTLVHHLGLRVVDVDAHSDLYRFVRWSPPFTREEVVGAVRAGAPFVHPVKDVDAAELLRLVTVE